MHFPRHFYQAGLVGLLLLTLYSEAVRAQSTEPWTQFSTHTKEEYKYGYKDAYGRIRIPAKFGSFTNAMKFNNIMAVGESKSYRQYYLLKNGRTVGRDSVYMFDYTPDCENEGKIRFRDARRNRVGFFDARGKVVIPARYNYVTPFHNGLAVGLIGARQTCGSGFDTLHCEHPGWTGGRTVLLNARNEVLVDSFVAPNRSSGYLNWYSLKINTPTPDTATTVSFRAVNGDQYTFLDYEKEFRHWLYEVFVPIVRAGQPTQVQALCFADIAVSTRPFRGWPHFTPAAFVAKYQRATLLPKLGALQRVTPGVSIFSGDLNTLTFTSSDFQPFLTNCGEHFSEKYPVFELMLTYPAQPASAPVEHQEHFEFIRTASGYRLFSVSL
jgi:hypothetical protein